MKKLICLSLAIFLLFTLSSSKYGVSDKNNKKPVESYIGKVDGIDAQATTGQPPRCQAFINKNSSEYIQVTTTQHTLQTLLELASFKNVEVEVSYNDSGGEKTLTRVRILDRNR